MPQMRGLSWAFDDITGELVQGKHPFVYSDCIKACVALQGHLVPNKVVEWRMGNNLTQVLTQSKERRSACGAVIACRPGYNG